MKTLLVFSASLAVGFFGVTVYKKETTKMIAPQICPIYPEIKFSPEEVAPPEYKHCEKCLTGVYRWEGEQEVCSFCARAL
jgi:hypothetical protein